MDRLDIEARLVFKSEPARHAFMMKAIDKEDFVYRLAGGDSVILSQDNADRLKGLAEKFGGVAMQADKPNGHVRNDLPDREERIQAWNKLESEILSLEVP